MVLPLISYSYREQNRKLHEENEVYGANSAKYFKQVVRLMQKTDCKTVLDYGCGKGGLVKALLDHGMLARGYDPAVEEFFTPQEPADLVVCTDVLEHIEPEYITMVLDDLHRLTLRAIYLIVATGPAQKVLPDGRNAHLIQKSSRDWLYDLLPRFKLVEFMDAGRGFAAVMSK